MEKISPKEEKRPESVDIRWFKKFELITSGVEVIDSLEGDGPHREKQRIAFMNGEVENPVLDNRIDLDLIRREESELLSLKEEIIREEKNEAVLQAYRWRINERIALLRMLMATESGDMRRFKRYSEFIYGKPNTEIFFQILDLIHSEYTAFVEEGDSNIKSAFQSFFSELYPTEAEVAKKPSEETISFVREWVKKEIDELNLDIAPRSEKYTYEEIIAIFQEALDKIAANGWQAVINQSGTGINTSQAKKTLEVPISRQVGSLKLKQLVLHEIKTHVERRVKGENSRLSLLGLGLDRYEGAEEGIATIKEQGLSNKGTFDFAGLEGYLAIGIATGQDGTPRDFRRTYELLKNYFYLVKRKKGLEHESALKEAELAAWKRCVRTFKGTDCKTPGVCFTKDIVYREGNIAIWDLVGRDQESVLRFSIGKYDPTNPRHLWILSQLEITDETLNTLEDS